MFYSTLTRKRSDRANFPQDAVLNVVGSRLPRRGMGDRRRREHPSRPAAAARCRSCVGGGGGGNITIGGGGGRRAAAFTGLKLTYVQCESKKSPREFF